MSSDIKIFIFSVILLLLILIVNHNKLENYIQYDNTIRYIHINNLTRSVVLNLCVFQFTERVHFVFDSQRMRHLLL